MMNYTIHDIEEALRSALTPEYLAVRDDSHKHIGHSGYVEGVITHIHVAISGKAFAAQSRIANHRAVNQVLAPFMESGLHAVAIHIQ